MNRSLGFGCDHTTNELFVRPTCWSIIQKVRSRNNVKRKSRRGRAREQSTNKFCRPGKSLLVSAETSIAWGVRGVDNGFKRASDCSSLHFDPFQSPTSAVGTFSAFLHSTLYYRSLLVLHIRKRIPIFSEYPRLLYQINRAERKQERTVRSSLFLP
jgi:hypothetical protein